jgi:hypothetical protein
MIGKLVAMGILTPQDVVEYMNASILSLEKTKAAPPSGMIVVDQAPHRLQHMRSGYLK